MDLPRHAGTDAGPRRGARTRGAAGAAEPPLGLRQDPGRAARPRTPGGRRDDPPDSGRRRPRPRTATHIADLAPVPGHPDIRHPGLRLLACGHRAAHPAVCAVRDGDRDPRRAHRGRHRPSDGGLDRAAGPQPPDEPRRPRQRVQVPDSRQGQQVHRGARACSEPGATAACPGWLPPWPSAGS